MCDKCSKMMVTCAMGTCSNCSKGTSSSSYKYCKTCAMTKGACQACGEVMQGNLPRGAGGPAR